MKRTKAAWVIGAVVVVGGLLASLPTPEPEAAANDDLPSERFGIQGVRVFDGEHVVESTTVVVDGGMLLKA